MKLPEQNAKYIQHLNQNMQILSQNIETLELGMKKLDDSMSNASRDTAATQQAMVAFLREKDIIQDEDLKLLRKLHMQAISKLDQEIAERKEKRDQE